MRTGSLAVVVAALTALTVLLPAPAGASAAPPKSALRFVAAISAAEKRVAALRGPIAEGLAAVRFDTCFAVLQEPVPDEARAHAHRLELMALNTVALEPVQRVLERIVADLDAVRTNDPALRAGRLSWRAEARLGRRLPPMPAACDLLAAWKAAGFAPAAAPPLPARARQALDRADWWAYENLRRRQRAVERLGNLGIARRDARAFMGDALWNDVLPARFREPAPSPP